MSARVLLPTHPGRRSQAVQTGLHLFFFLILSPPSPFLSSLSLFLSWSSRPSSDPNFWETFFSKFLPSRGAGGRRCAPVRGAREREGGGRERLRGKKASPRPMAKREQEKPCRQGPMRGGERLRLWPRLRAGCPRDAPGPTLTPGFPVPPRLLAGRRGAKSRGLILCRYKLLQAPNPYLFLPNLLGLIDLF